MRQAFAGKLRSELDDHTLALDQNALTFDTDTLNLPMCRLSRWVLAHSDLSAICQRRRANYLLLAHTLVELPGVRLLFPNLPVNLCPYLCPVFFDDLPNAHLLLRDHGIPATAWDGVRPRDLARQDFPNADFLYENLIFLPIHQDLGDQHMHMIAEAVRSVRRNSRTRAAV